LVRTWKIAIEGRAGNRRNHVFEARRPCILNLHDPEKDRKKTRKEQEKKSKAREEVFYSGCGE
jgi:hypothetical protein